jgi:hypothetical protein
MEPKNHAQKHERGAVPPLSSHLPRKPRSPRRSGAPSQKSRGAAEATAALAFLRAVEHLRRPIISRNVVFIRAGHKSSSEFAAMATADLSIILKDVEKIGVRRISSPATINCRIRKFWTSCLVLGRRVPRTCLLVLLGVFARGLGLEIPVECQFAILHSPLFAKVCKMILSRSDGRL